MKNVVTRSLSGVVYIALIVSCLWAGSFATALLFALFGAFAAIELKKIMVGPPYTGIYYTSLGLDILAVGLMALLPLLSGDAAWLGVSAAVVLFLFPMLRFVLALYDKRENAFLSAVASVMAPAYIGLPMMAVTAMRSLSAHGFFLVLTMFILIWLNDTGAYCVGSTMGRNKMFPRLSPKKSWEGFFGGLVFCVIASVTAWYINTCGMSLVSWLGFGLMVCALSTLGDLFESLLKRNHHIKDSGNLIPGHGGILDRIDSLLFVAVGSVIYLIFAGAL